MDLLKTQGPDVTQRHLETLQNSLQDDVKAERREPWTFEESCRWGRNEEEPGGMKHTNAQSWASSFYTVL